jgi:hypothetical protein
LNKEVFLGPATEETTGAGCDKDCCFYSVGLTVSAVFCEGLGVGSSTYEAAGASHWRF